MIVLGVRDTYSVVEKQNLSLVCMGGGETVGHVVLGLQYLALGHYMVLWHNW